MAVIWGLDLHDMQWYKFKGSYMFAGTYHLQTTKMIVYQCAMIFMVISESVGTAALSDYVDQQDGIQERTGYHTQNNDIVGVMSYNIFCGIAVATIFGAGFFFDLFWPERSESHDVHLAWRICAVIVSILALADAIALTVVVATGNAFIKGVSRELNDRLFRENGRPKPVYKHNPYCVTSAVFVWVGVACTFGSTYILFRSHIHDAKFGPRSRAHRNAALTAEKGEPKLGHGAGDIETAQLDGQGRAMNGNGHLPHPQQAKAHVPVYENGVVHGNGHAGGF